MFGARLDCTGHTNDEAGMAKQFARFRYIPSTKEIWVSKRGAPSMEDILSRWSY